MTLNDVIEIYEKAIEPLTQTFFSGDLHWKIIILVEESQFVLTHKYEQIYIKEAKPVNKASPSGNI